MEFRSGFRHERVGSEDLQRFFHVSEMRGLACLRKTSDANRFHVKHLA
jgi:hypothetical protein